MTEIEKQALALVNEMTPYEYVNTSDACHNHILKALYRAIEQHEQFKREVSDAIIDCGAERYLGRFILPKPDPLVEALNDMKDGCAGQTTESYAACLRVAIEARGGRIVWEGE